MIKVATYYKCWSVSYSSGGKWEVKYLDNKQLLGNNSPFGRFRNFYRAHRKTPFRLVHLQSSCGSTRAHHPPRYCEPPGRKTRKTAQSAVRARCRNLSPGTSLMVLGRFSARFEGGDEISVLALRDSAEIQTMLMLDASDQNIVLAVNGEPTYC